MTGSDRSSSDLDMKKLELKAAEDIGVVDEIDGKLQRHFTHSLPKKFPYDVFCSMRVRLFLTLSYILD